VKLKKLLFTAIALGLLSAGAAAAPRELLNNGWSFSLGHASNAEKDFGHGTEYFTYLCKVRANNQSQSPIMPEFDDSQWQQVNLPHDWVVDLPFSGEASHSHGYKCIGWKWPENSVGWYRKKIFVPKEDEGKRITIEFEGIFRDSEVFCNGIYLGHERSGYASRVYDLSEVLDYGAENLICVRVDASVEEGWFYEGAGIYRNVYLSKGGKLAVEPYGLMANTELQTVDASQAAGKVSVQARIRNYGHEVLDGKTVNFGIYDADGNLVSSSSAAIGALAPQQNVSVQAELKVNGAQLWSPERPYLYTLKTEIDGDMSETRIGLRKVEFTHEQGMLLNGKKYQMRGCNLHQDQAGVGAGIPDELWRYKLEILKKYGFNTIRSSHNPASPALLDLCDELGFVVIDENRLMGTGDEQLGLLEDMIRRDANHPSVVLWSVGNEEWAIEWNVWGTRIAQKMTEFAHQIDPSRPTIYASSSGQAPNYGCDVFGYNYIVQNPVMENWQTYPNTAVGTEETTGCGTRGKYETNAEEGWMLSFNRSGVAVDERYSPDSLGVIERGWRFYNNHPQFAGLCYWTGFDYRGESNPMVWPATGSQFGLLDYCGYPKDEAFYLKANWTEESLVHICGPVNGEVWVYSNCDKVLLKAGGKKLGTKTVVKDGHLVWKLTAKQLSAIAAGKSSIEATGLTGGKKVATDRYPEQISGTSFTLSKTTLKADGQDVVVVDIVSNEKSLDVTVEGVQFLGWGNGNPGFKEVERPVPGSTAADGSHTDNVSQSGTAEGSKPVKLEIKPFSGRAQVILRSLDGVTGEAKLKIGSQEVRLQCR